ncbi:hypothetical protein [Halobellus rufus]|uniref:hypothetical protein n=1 Tax=Halobellus rufus TaxID=1448860 RepID=UPI0012E0A1F9|nr:hypothetical protein [Halobellus rufus]
MSEGQYEQAEAALGDEYTQLLSQYADVSEDGDGTSSAESFEQARTQQQTVSEELSEYQRTYQAYREAKAAGNETRTRALARELLALQNGLEENVSELNGTYTEIQTSTEVDVSTERDRLQSVSQNVSETSTEIRSAEFTSTQLSVRTEEPHGSFIEPIEITGALRTADGEPIESSTVAISVGEQTHSVQTTERGSFTLSYRPVTHPVDLETVTVAYEPSNASLYLGANDTINVSVSQTTATVQLQNVSDSAGFNDRVTVRGSVSVNGTPVGNLPLEVQLDEETLSTGTTMPNGSFVIDGRVDESPAVGAQPLTITSSQQNRSIAVSSANTTLDIVQYESTLTATTSPDGNESMLLSGRLSGPENRSLPEKTLTVQAHNETVTELSTGADGTYERSIALSRLPENASTLTVQYAATDSNLNSASATATVPHRMTASESGILTTLQQPLPVLVIVGTLLSLSGGGVYAYRQRRTTQSQTAESEQTTTSHEDDTTADQPTDADTDVALSSATAALDRGETDQAVVMAYTAIRAQIADHYSVPTQATHWQFYTAAVDKDLPVRAEFEELTTRYEQAQYAPEPVSTATAETTIETAANIADGLDPQTSNADTSRADGSVAELRTD